MPMTSLSQTVTLAMSGSRSLVFTPKYSIACKQDVPFVVNDNRAGVNAIYLYLLTNTLMLVKTKSSGHE